jgi:phage major head subunit gpT-like protein
MITGNVPNHLLVSARTGFLSAIRATKMPWQQIAMQVNMDAAAIDLVDLGAAPMPIDSSRGVTYQDFIERSMTLTPTDWDITVWISQNAIDDDQTGSLERKVRSAGDNFQKHINKRVFQVLNAGDSQTYGAAYDGQDFFDSDHVDAGGQYTTGQDNEAVLTLSDTNFNTAWAAAQSIVDDQGNYLEYNYDLLVVNPLNWKLAMNITGNPMQSDTANNTENPFSGMMKLPVSSPYLDSTAWYLIASSEAIKPLIVAMKKAPHLQSAWFDPRQPDGGRHYFKFFARYEVHYGLWQLAYQGNT